MYAEGTDLSVFSAPLKFSYLVPDTARCPSWATAEACAADSSCEWHVATAGSAASCTGTLPGLNGTVLFRVQNMRTDVFFIYVSGGIQYPSIVAASRTVRQLWPERPQHAHLALGASAGAMRVYWQAGGSVAAPGVRYGPCGGPRSGFAAGRAAPGRQYTKRDMCDRDVQPAGRHGWLPPGNLLEATMSGLVPGELYCYSYGDRSTGWSEERQFKAPPGSTARRPITIAAFGDMGQTEPDGTWHHSWDFDNRGELPSANTTAALFKDEAVELVLHIGDISYAVGYLSEWENFFRQIEPVAGRRPWMTAIGNHEMGVLDSFYSGTDSGGECGVPYNAHFPFASQDPESLAPLHGRKPWYSFAYGPVSFVVMSTEHDFTPGSEQHAWIAGALAAVDRSRTPWLVFTGHRPMYVSSDFEGDLVVGEQLRSSLEPLLLEYGVDVSLWGHFHAYNRLCRLRAGRCDDSGVQHLVIGMAGYAHSACARAPGPTVQVCDDQHWGYLRMGFRDEAELLLEYVDSANGDVLDSIVVRRSRASATESPAEPPELHV